MTTLTGKLNLGSVSETARMLAVTEDGRVCAEASTDAAGQWALECAETPTMIVAHTFGDSLLVAAADPDESSRMSLPEGFACRVECQGADPRARFALDPVDLGGVPAAAVAALHRRADGTVALSLAEWDCASTPRTIALQSGIYRVSGGSIAIQLGAPAGSRLSSVKVGDRAVPPDGSDTFEFDIDGPAAITLGFSPRGTP